MIRALQTVLCLLVCLGPLRAASPPPGLAPAFAEAQKAYDAGDAARACDVYQGILDSGWVSPALLFNLGNAHFRAGRPGPAIQRYRQALRLAPGDADIRANLRFAVERSGASVPEPWLLAEAMRRVSRAGWVRLALAAWWTGALLVSLRWVRPRSRIPAGWVTGLAAGTVAVALAGARVSGGLADSREAVAMVPGLEIRSAPTAESTALVRLPEGSIVEILEDGGPWLRVRSGKESGWIPASAAGRVRL